jgi:hypothetical protein
MRILRDVVVDRTSRDELMAVCHVPGVLGETMTLDLMGGGITLGLKVTVLESRPVVIDGAVRHRLRLGMVPVAVDGCERRTAADANCGVTAEAL